MVCGMGLQSQKVTDGEAQEEKGGKEDVWAVAGSKSVKAWQMAARARVPQPGRSARGARHGKHCQAAGSAGPAKPEPIRRPGTWKPALRGSQP